MSDILRQKVDHLDTLYSEAEAARPELEDLIVKIARRVGGEALVPADLKDRVRAEQKLKTDYRGDASQLTDLLRGRIVVDSLEQADAATRALSGETDLCDVRDRLRKPLPHGYRNRAIKARLGGGHIAEIQIRLRCFHELEAQTHATYRQIREIQAQDKNDPRLFDLYLENLLRYERTTARYNATTKGEKLPQSDFGHALGLTKPPTLKRPSEKSVQTPERGLRGG